MKPSAIRRRDCGLYSVVSHTLLSDMLVLLYHTNTFTTPTHSPVRVVAAAVLTNRS